MPPPAATHNKHPERLISIRRSLFRRFGLLGVGAVALLAIGYLNIGVRPVVTSIADSHFSAAAEQVEASLKQLFQPAESLVRLAGQWARTPGFTIDRAEEFNTFFLPILKEVPQLTSVVAGTDRGEGWMLLQLADGKWRNRLTDIPRHGMEQHLIEWEDGSAGAPKRESVFYDPRLRPWYQLAMGAPADGRVHWTEPYAFFTTGEPGITVSVREDLADGRSMVVGFDIKLIDISRTTTAVQVGQNGYVLVLTPDRRILGLPRPASGGTADLRQSRLLSPVDTLGLDPVTTAVRQWQGNGQPGGRILHVPVAAEPWLATFRPFLLGEQTLWVMILAPESDFIPPRKPMLQALSVILLIVLGVTLLLARQQARRVGAPLEALAADSARIARLDFSGGQPLQTSLREISLLANAHGEMRSILQHFHHTVEAQAASLREQIVALRITESRLRLSESQLKAALAQQQAILDNALVGIFFVRDRTVVQHNRRLAELMGVEEGELVGQSTDRLDDRQKSCLAIGEEAYTALTSKGSFAEEIRFRRPDGSRFWGHLSGHAIVPDNPHAGSVWILTDLTERKDAEEKLAYLGQHDPLTHLPNRVLLNDRISHAIHRAEPGSDRLAVLFIDLDHFKTVNDTLGHEIGDRLLCVVADRLASCLRAGDTLSRLGGDEFIILIEGVEVSATVADLAVRLIKAIAAPCTIDARQIYITGSIGISVFPDDSADPAALIRNADAAMYQAKEQGRNTYHFYSEEMTRRALERMEIENHLRLALENGGLELFFQPQVNLHDGSTVGAEALVRLRHPERGLIGPLEFIPIAEETGMIFPLGEWVLEESCRQWLALKKEGFTLPRLGINFSVKQLRRSNFLEMVGAVLARTGMPPSALEIEITESFFLETEGAFELMQTLGERGITLAVDDFGTGYSSLNYLRRLPFGKLKIDQSFVREIGRNPDGATLVRTIISMAGTLGLEVIAEGVETEAEKEFLLREGCFQGQGFLFARPMPAADLCRWLESHPLASLPTSSNSVS